MPETKLDLLSVCFLLAGSGFGGAETVVINLALDLKRRGWTVRLVSMMPPGERAEELNSNGIEVASLMVNAGLLNDKRIFNENTQQNVN